MRSRILTSTNPMLRSIGNQSYDSEYSVTYMGVSVKTIFLFALLVLSGFTAIENIEYLFTNLGLLIGASIGAFVAALLSGLFPKLAYIFAPIYSILIGVFLGGVVMGVSIAYGTALPQTAFLLTLTIFGTMLILFMAGVVRVGPFLRRFTYSMLSGLVLFSLIVFILSLSGSALVTLLYQNSSFMLLFSLIGAATATLMILIDLDNCSRMVQAGAPKEFEWGLALGLIITIVWLFMKILRILMILASRRD